MKTKLKAKKEAKEVKEIKQVLSDYFDLASTIYDDCKSNEEKFKKFATYLLNQFEMKIGNDVITLEELEIYYKSEDHQDNYTHQCKDQLTNKMWYFHQYHNGTYKSGTYKGLDITFGNKEKSIYGGVLIRSINNSTTNEFITGPCNTVNYMLKKMECKEVEDLVAKMSSLNICNNKNPFYLVENSESKQDKIFTGPRVGLSWKYPTFLTKEYRYLKQPSKIPKHRASIVGSLYNTGLKQPEITTQTKISKASVEKAIEEFNDGCKLTEKEVKELKHDKICKIFGYYCNQNKNLKSVDIKFAESESEEDEKLKKKVKVKESKSKTKQK